MARRPRRNGNGLPLTTGDPVSRSDQLDRKVNILTTFEISPRAVLLTLLIVLMSQAIVIIYTVQNTNKLQGLANQNAGFIQTISDCTDPKGECYQREEKRKLADEEERLAAGNRLVNDALAQIAATQQQTINDALASASREHQDQLRQLLDELRRLRAEVNALRASMGLGPTSVPEPATPKPTPPPTVNVPPATVPPNTVPPTTTPPNIVCGLLGILC